MNKEINDFHINNILKEMSDKDYQGYLLADFSNIKYISNYMPTSFAFCVLKENPVIYASKMDMEIANKTSTIEVKEFESFSEMIAELKGEIKNLAIEPSLEYSTYEKFRGDFRIASEIFINKQRAIKTSDEIAKIDKATGIAQKAFVDLDILSLRESKSFENTSAYELGKLMREYGGEGESFDTILVSGSATSLPHAVPKPKAIEDIILVDWGAKYDGYCSDNTRTMVYSEKQQEIFDIVKESHDKAIKAIKPGIKCCEIDKVARDIISEYGYGDKYIHSTGHSLGLDIHETPSFSAKDETIIEKGMVITVEPGIYLEGDFGVRLEDTVAIDNKARILGNLPAIIE
ncbi:M24 family metallopeptidase [Methanobrevibacter woesei]|uniref:M24 family metallopeptidase n=1 Tax=Methanobrevibacter woesei TaxID=190976 RepID=UPI0023538190|nr:M24 family metallopeptidase [Methanobrevibacter woesei]